MNNNVIKQRRVSRVVVLGTGFAGLSFLENLNRIIKKNRMSWVKVTAINSADFMLFSPLLYQVATAEVSDEHISISVSEQLRKMGFNFLDSDILKIDLKSNKVTTAEGELPYDYLVISLGTENNDFGVKGVQEHSIPLKSLRDALEIRQILQGTVGNFQMKEGMAGREKSQNTFVVVGGGASGVELAGSIAEYVNSRGISGGNFGVELIEARNHLVGGEDPKLSETIRKELVKSGVRVHLSKKVDEITSDEIRFSDRTSIRTSHVFWAAGVRNRRIVTDLLNQGLYLRSGRIQVNGNLRALGSENVFVLGDNALPLFNGNSQNIPQTAAVAVQEGKYAAKALAHLLLQGNLTGYPGFKVRDSGLMVTLGKFNGVCRLPSGMVFTGFAGWLLWRFVHLVKIRPMRNKIGVLFDWVILPTIKFRTALGRKSA